MQPKIASHSWIFLNYRWEPQQLARRCNKRSTTFLHPPANWMVSKHWWSSCFLQRPPRASHKLEALPVSSASHCWAFVLLASFKRMYSHPVSGWNYILSCFCSPLPALPCCHHQFSFSLLLPLYILKMTATQAVQYHVPGIAVKCTFFFLVLVFQHRGSL